MSNSNINNISWEAFEHNHITGKNSDWLWGLSIVSLGAIVLCIYFGNYLLAIIFALFTVTSIMLKNRKPELHQFQISRKGVRAGNLFFPFSNLKSFWVDDNEYDDKIIFKTKKSLHGFLIIPFDSNQTDPELIRDVLLDYLDEEELEEPFHQKLMEFLGF
jgi:hypothetical protein